MQAKRHNSLMCYFGAILMMAIVLLFMGQHAMQALPMQSEMQPKIQKQILSTTFYDGLDPNLWREPETYDGPDLSTTYHFEPDPKLRRESNKMRIKRKSKMSISAPHWQNRTKCKNKLEPFESIDANRLWTADVANRPAIGKISFVVAHCNKRLDWIWRDFTQGYEISDVTVYSKCEVPVEDLPSNGKVIRLPNVGRNDHSFVYHMARLNASPSEFNDIVVFWKDNPFRLKDRRINRDFSSLLQIASVNGFACGIRPVPVSNIGFRGAYPYPAFEPSVFHYHDMWRSFEMVRYVREPTRDRQLEFKECPYSTLGAYVDAMNISVPKPYLQVCYGGLFATTKGQIMKTPTSIWRAIEQSLSRGSNIKEGHYLERCWGGILAKPLSPDQVELLDKKRHCYFCGESYSVARCGILGYFHNPDEVVVQHVACVPPACVTP